MRQPVPLTCRDTGWILSGWRDSNSNKACFPVLEGGALSCIVAGKRVLASAQSQAIPPVARVSVTISVTTPDTAGGRTRFHSGENGTSRLSGQWGGGGSGWDRPDGVDKAVARAFVGGRSWHGFGRLIWLPDLHDNALHRRRGQRLPVPGVA
jgi:hypothetical protein